MSTHKGIGFWSGCQLLINNTVGPALVLLPALFQQSGYSLVLLALAVISMLSYLSAMMLSRTLQHHVQMKNQHRSYLDLEDDNYHKQQQSVTLYQMMSEYISHGWLLKSFLLIYVVALMLRLMAAIIQSGQIIDFALNASYLGKTCGLALGVRLRDIEWLCTADAAFGGTLCVISVGFMLLMLVCLVLAKLVDFDDVSGSISLQWFANIVVLGLLCVWLYIFCTEPSFSWDEHSKSSATPTGGNPGFAGMAHVVSVLAANYAFIIPIPSWFTQRSADMKSKHTLLQKTFQYSLLFVFVLFALVGVFGAKAYSAQTYREHNGNLFAVLSTSEHAGVLGKASVYLFPVAQNITIIPVMVVIIAFNIKNFGIPYQHSLVVAAILPCVLSVLFFTGDGFNQICDASSIFLSVISFVLPPVLFLKMKQSKAKVFDMDDQEANADETDDSEALIPNKTNHLQLPEPNMENREPNEPNDLLHSNPVYVSYAMLAVSIVFCIVTLLDKFIAH